MNDPFRQRSTLVRAAIGGGENLRLTGAEKGHTAKRRLDLARAAQGNVVYRADVDPVHSAASSVRLARGWYRSAVLACSAQGSLR